MGRFDLSDAPVVINGKARCKFPFLVSYAYLRKTPPELVERLLMDSRREVLLDSGAFTAFNAGHEIEMSEYLAFLHRWKHLLFGYMALDKLQDPVATDRQYREMLANGLQPIPIHVYGEDGPRMEEFFKDSEWVACGGFRRPHRGPAPVEYVKQKMEWAAGRPVHWLGYVNDPLIRSFRPFSADCSTAFSAMMFGNCSIYLGNSKWWVGTLEKWAEAPTKQRAELRKAIFAYGVNPDGMDDPEMWRWGPNEKVDRWVKFSPTTTWDASERATSPSAHYIAHISVRSWVRYILDIRRHFGTRVFLASSPEQRHDQIVDAAIEWASDRGWAAPLVSP